jgi:hypothetical protein
MMSCAKVLIHGSLFGEGAGCRVQSLGCEVNKRNGAVHQVARVRGAMQPG